MDPCAHEDLEGAPSTSGPRVRSAPLMKAGEQAAAAKGARRTRRTWLALLAVVGVASGVAVGNALAVRRERGAAVRGAHAWHGRVARVARSGAEGEAKLTALWPGGRKEAIAEGAEVAAGMTLVTDAKTRARLELDDGSVVAV